MSLRNQIQEDYIRFSNGLPTSLETYILDRYGISLASEYGGIPIKNPFGKASGQLSLNVNQIAHDTEAGLGFVVLKTVIAQDETGAQSMKAWAIPAAKMTVEAIVGTREAVRGDGGWTVSWKGRGWSESFDAYLQFFNDSIPIGLERGMLIVPSVKYHLPRPEETSWRTKEYEYTTSQLYAKWTKYRDEKMPLEKDFSPTLAGDVNFSHEQENIFAWLLTVPQLIRSTSAGTHITVGLKIFNAAFDDGFQLSMLNTCAASDHPADYLIYGNRLFDPNKPYDGTIGIAYGGPDLRDRNLSVLDRWKTRLPFSATGNIITGNAAFEYLKRGASSFQMHTLFQLPDSEFDMKGGTRTTRALHRLLFHPTHGFLSAVISEQEKYRWSHGISISDIATFYASTR